MDEISALISGKSENRPSTILGRTFAEAQEKLASPADVERALKLVHRDSEKN